MTTISLRERAAAFGLEPAEFDLVCRALGREPNLLETAVFGALWSEHCGYKNSRPLLRRLPTAGPQVLQGPGENAGVVDVGEGWAVAFKMESHNHPSAVEPVQGAATGVGGILRDIFAMGARPIAVLDSLRFGDPGSNRTRYLVSGVVHGIAHYGNAIGVPTVGGDIFFHPCYQENPLVNVMAVGLLRHQQLQSGTLGRAGNMIVYLGSRTGRDGLGGAVFASADLSEASSEDRPAVQVGDPFLEKLLLEACLEATAQGLVAGVQDMGAAGLSSSVAEMAHRAGLGVDLHLDRVPCREAGMTPVEIMLSESQERMLLAVEPNQLEPLLALLEQYELEAVPVGTVRDHGRLKLYHHGRLEADLPVAPLNEAPTYTREGREDPTVARLRAITPAVPEPADLGAVLLSLLADPTVASKRPVFEQYDHQVMTNTVVPPGAGDAAVLRIKGSRRGIAAATDGNPRYCYLDPYQGARHAVAEAARNCVCVGAKPLAITNNLNFGNPTQPEVYYQLERAVDGLRDACLALGTPVTGGNVSLYNQYRTGAGEGVTFQAIHPTPTVGMIGVLEDVSRHATTAFGRPGEIVYLVGDAATAQLGASLYLAGVHGREEGAPPPLDLELERRVQQAVLRLIEQGYCQTAHDCSDGGLAVAVAEMAIAGGVGASIALPDVARADVLLFGEAPSRIVVAVAPDAAAGAEAELVAADVPWQRLGVVGGSTLRLELSDGRCIELAVDALAERHARALEEVLA